jgi:hypothetical protein
VHHRSISRALLVAVVILVVPLVAGVGRAFAFGFASHADFATGTNPISVATGDFNADGKLDLVTANYVTGTASVLLGDGAGGFAAKTDFATGPHPYGTAVGDVNADGKPDVVTANYGGGSLTVLLGDGSGAFAAASGSPFSVGSGTGPESVAMGDFNADGKVDLATANIEGDSASLLLGDGSGAFTAAPGSPFTTGDAPRGIALGDFNADSKLDLATANYNDSSVSLLLGDGSGGFGAKSDFSTGWSPYRVAAADFNADGKLDLVTDNIVVSTVSVLLGNGAGSFAAKADFATGVSPYGLVAADLDGDGKVEVATVSTSAFAVSVLLNNGVGSFGFRTDFATGNNPYGMAAGDFNADGKLDLVTANTSVNTVSLLLQRAAPAGTMTVEGGATYATSTAVTINSAVNRANQMRFKNEGGSWSSWESYSATKSWTLASGDGPKTISAEYGDPPGNVVALSDTIELDHPPTGSFTIGVGSGYASSRTVTLHPTATDIHAPVELQVRNAGAAWPSSWTTLTADTPFTLSSLEGEKTVEMRFRDGLGLVGDAVSMSVVVDATPPGGWVNIADGAYAVDTHSVAVDTWAIDLNGLVVMRLHCGGEPWPSAWTPAGGSVPTTLPSGEGTKVVQAQFKDLAGNIVLVQDEIVVDTIDPVGSLSIDGGASYTTDANVVLALTASDATKVDAFKVRQDGGEWSAWQDMVEAQPLALTGSDGAHTLEVQYRDIAGNLSDVASDTIVLDRAAPETTPASDALWHSPAYGFALHAADLSPVTKHWYVAGRELLPQTGDVDLDPDRLGRLKSGTYTVVYWSTDAAGNAEAAKTVQVKLDAQPPVTHDDSDGLAHATDVTVQFSGYDDASGTAHTYYQIDGSGSWTEGTSALIPATLGDGTHCVWYYSVDAAGNTEPTRVTWVVLSGTGYGSSLATDAPTGAPTTPGTVSAPRVKHHRPHSATPRRYRN